MPLYEYYCPPCGSQFDVLRPVSQMDSPAVCPEGHTTNNRVLSIFSPLPRGNANVATAMLDQNPGAGDDCCGGGRCC